MQLPRNAVDPSGMIRINAARVLIVSVLVGCLTANLAVANPGEGTLFGVRPGELLTIDPDTGLATVIGGLGFGATPSLAREPLTGTLFLGQGAGAPNVYTVDPTTGVPSLVGDSGLGFAAIGSLDFRADGVLFAAVNIAGDGGTGSDHLATIDTVTGAATVIGPFGTCIGVSLITPRVPDKSLNRFYECIHTPVLKEEPHGEPFTLPEGMEPTIPKKLIDHPDFEIPYPSALGAVGFVVLWAAVAGLIAVVYALAR